VDKAKLMQRLMATFLDELDEHVRALNRDLLGLEKEPAEQETSAERFKTLFRTAHSLKGAARAVDVTLIEAACHRLEEILAAARDNRLSLGRDQFALLFATADALEEAGMRLREQKDLSDAPLAGLLPRLDAAAQGASPLATFVSPNPLGARWESAKPGNAVESPPTVPEPVGVAGTVRVAADKLDAFLARSGELLVARRRIWARSEDLAAVQDLVGQWKAEWHFVEKTLRKDLRSEENGFEDRESAVRVIPRRAARVLQRTGDQLRQLEKDLERLTAALMADCRFLDQTGGALDDEVRRVRMLPFDEACQGLDRMVRDLAAACGKEVDLVIEGGAVELDRSVLEGLKDPLRHLVRNAVDHGAELSGQRRAAGKSPRARITVAAVLRGAQVEVVVSDDGRGLDLEALRQQARRRHLPEPADDYDLAQLIFLPGLSTAPLITDVSGRGVGMDVVKSQVEALHGTVALAFNAGQGTRFTLAVPLTLTTLRALLVAAGGQTWAVVGTNVHQLLRVDPGAFRSVEGRDVLIRDGPPLPVASLAQTLGVRPTENERADNKVLALVVAAGEKHMVFLVDEFIAEQEIVIKSLGARIHRVPYIAGATLLPSGEVALVLNAANLVRSALARGPGRSAQVTVAPVEAAARKRVLIAEDSITTRTLVKSILEAAGYEVTAAADGAAAWQVLQEQGTDLLVSDVEMPRMDGFALTEAVRGSKRFAELPVVLVTSRETEADKARGVSVGANAYLVKSAFDQRSLLETIAQLL
jgi:two-component system chemotaxis sensor kinase CheA